MIWFLIVGITPAIVSLLTLIILAKACGHLKRIADAQQIGAKALSDIADEMAADEEEEPEDPAFRREAIAALALAGYCSGKPSIVDDELAQWAVGSADALIAELDKPKEVEHA